MFYLIGHSLVNYKHNYMTELMHNKIGNVLKSNKLYTEIVL